MAKYSLVSTPALGGYRNDFAGTMLEELSGLSIVSIACPRHGEEALEQAMQDAYAVGFPAPGRSVLSRDGMVRFLGMGADQAMAIFAHAGDDGDLIIASKLGSAGYYTLQSDNWVALRLAGTHAVPALRRICPIDLDLQAFPKGSVARTITEHMGSIIIAEPQDDSFLLLSAWSSARSFLHAVETSVKGVL